MGGMIDGDRRFSTHPIKTMATHVVLSEDKRFTDFYNEMKNELKSYQCNFFYPRERKIEVDEKVLEKLNEKRKKRKKKN